jgi:hypothetical protein
VGSDQGRRGTASDRGAARGRGGTASGRGAAQAGEEQQAAEARRKAGEEWQTNNKRRSKQEQPLAPQKQARKTELSWKRYQIFVISAVATLSLLVLVGAWMLFKPLSAPPKVANGSPLTVVGNSTATTISFGIPAPRDPRYSQSDLRATITRFPLNGEVTLADGSTVYDGERLTLEQLTGLKFIPAHNPREQSSTLDYTVKNPAGMTTASGSIAITIAPDNTITIAPN